MSRSVLIADDDPDIREALAEILREEGFEPLCVENGRAALDALHGAPPSAVLLDMTRPGELDGCAVLRMKAADPSIANIPVIVMTGQAQASVPADGLTAVLHKPFSIRQLLRLLDAAAGGPRPTPRAARY